jgi:N-acetylglucosamine-6-phosphate deacetylase
VRTGPDRLVLTHARLHSGGTTLEDAVVVIEGDSIVAAGTAGTIGRPSGTCVDLSGRSLSPGLIDLQVNGGGGVLFNERPDVDALAAMAAAHLSCGTTDLLATYVTGPRRGMEAAGAAVALGVVEGVLGVHFEGPLLSPDHRGVHDPAHLAGRADEQLIGLLSAPLRAGPTLVTVAPEILEEGVVAELVRRGAVVAAGHTGADPGRIRRAADEGLRAATHLWNAMPPVRSREPGPVTGLLGDPRVICGLIADGHHVSGETLRLSLAAAAGGCFLVSDAMPCVGLAGCDGFDMGGLAVSVRDGRCETADGRLAGGALPLIAGVRTLVSCGVAVADALALATMQPARVLGLDGRYGLAAPGYAARLVVLDEQLVPTAVVLGTEVRELAAGGQPGQIVRPTPGVGVGHGAGQTPVNQVQLRACAAWSQIDLDRGGSRGDPDVLPVPSVGEHHPAVGDELHELADDAVTALVGPGDLPSGPGIDPGDGSHPLDQPLGVGQQFVDDARRGVDEDRLVDELHADRPRRALREVVSDSARARRASSRSSQISSRAARVAIRRSGSTR